MKNSKHKLPSKELDAILAGEIHPSQASKAIQSWFRFFAWREAERLYPLDDATKKQVADKLPPGVRDIVREEFIRLTKIKMRDNM